MSLKTDSISFSVFAVDNVSNLDVVRIAGISTILSGALSLCEEMIGTRKSRKILEIPMTSGTSKMAIPIAGSVDI